MSSAAATADAPVTTGGSRKTGEAFWNTVLTTVGGVLVAGAGLWYFLTPSPPTPGERLNKSLELYDQQQHHTSREIAEELADEKYHDGDFAGGVEFVLGMTTFHQAMKPVLRGLPLSSEQLAEFAAAVAYLKEAYDLGLRPDRTAEWTYAMGKSLYSLNERSKALPYLEDSTAPENPFRLAAASDVIDISLIPGWRTPERLQSCLALSELIIEARQGTPELIDAQLQRVELMLHSGQIAPAHLLLDSLVVNSDQAAAQKVLKGRLLIAELQFTEAIATLEGVNSDGLEDATQSPRASFLMGYAAEAKSLQPIPEAADEATKLRAVTDAAEYRQRAIEYYRKTSTRFERSDEARAALMHLGRLQQEDGAHEKAVQSFGTVLRAVPRDTDFANRWFSLDDLRERILSAWNAWIKAELFQEAIVLSDLMTPTFPRDQAYELAALARQRWAELAEKKLIDISPGQRSELELETRRLWSEAAMAYAKLADVRRDSLMYPEAVWRATENSYRGHDFPKALEYLDEFLKEAPEAMRPVALVMKGQILLDLDRVADAEVAFRQVRKAYPTSPAAFTAAYQVAVCLKEQNKNDEADAAWRAILDSADLDPKAQEWRDSLFAVAKLQGDRAGYAWRKLESQTLNEAAVETLWNEVATRSRDATMLFEQYVARYPTADDTWEVRYELGKALQLQGDLWRRRWEEAETENAREQALSEKDRVLQRALDQFVKVRDALDHAGKNDQLAMTQMKMLENVWFETPHTLFSLGRYDEAISEYGSTIYRFPSDVRVLTAYVQMAEAYAKLNRPVEARSMLEQARVILDQDQIPPLAFKAPTTSLSEEEWEQWLDRARQVHRD
jgi:tetratricopeptide (TPR) repeat protein